MGAVSSSYNNSWNYYNPTPVVSASQIPVEGFLGGTTSGISLFTLTNSVTDKFIKVKYNKDKFFENNNYSITIDPKGTLLGNPSIVPPSSQVALA